ncbi:hypothetical protein LIER_40079 [Lithospermum erythrorhizon]|uniref:Uncharacterized protein n=1 Tax=Lithospermum erythrorhizon TaxID=34254 RepID=A0AAV3QPA6_LITER
MGLPINIPGLIGNIVFNAIEYRKNRTYPLGMLISFIVKRWAIMAYGPSTPPPLAFPISNRLIRYQWLQFDDARVHVLAKWQQGIPIDNNEGQEVQWEAANVEKEDAGVEGVEVRTKARDDFALWTKLHRLKSVQEEQGRAIKKNKSYLKRIMKFLSSFDKGEGSSSEAQEYLAHLDSNQDIEPSQITTQHHSLPRTTHHTSG